MLFAILLSLAIAAATAYWFGLLTPPTKTKKTPTAEPNKPLEQPAKKSEKKKKPTRRTAPRAAPKEKRKLPTDPRFLRRFGGHSDIVVAMAVSPNGEWLATTGKDGQIRVTQVEKGSDLYLNAMVERQGMFQDHLSCLSWSGDGRTLVGPMARRREMCFFRIRKKEGSTSKFPFELHEIIKRRFQTNSDEAIDTCLVDQAHSNFDLLLTHTPSGDRGNTVAWDGKTGSNIHSMSTGPGEGLCLSPEARFFCGRGAGSAQVKIFEVQRKKHKGEIEPVFESIHSVMTLIPEKTKIVDLTLCYGHVAVVCGEDGSVQLWDLNVEYRQKEDPNLILNSNVLKEKGKVTAVASSFRGDVNRIAVATVDANLHVLTFSSSNKQLTLDFSVEYTHPDGIAAMQFCPATGKTLYTKGNHSKDVFAWNVA